MYDASHELPDSAIEHQLGRIAMFTPADAAESKDTPTPATAYDSIGLAYTTDVYLATFVSESIRYISTMMGR